MAIKELNVQSYSAAADRRPVLQVVQGDRNAHIIRMVVQRYAGGVDLAGCAWRVNMVNASGGTDVHFCTGVVEDEREIRCDWLIRGAATSAAGNTRFQLEGGRQDGDAVQRVWQSDTYFIEVSEDLGADAVIAPPPEGNVGDVLTRTADGMGWAPPGGNALPLVFYGGDLPQVKEDAVMPFVMASGAGNLNLYCKTKAQGTSSMGYPKKNQTTKLFADADCTQPAMVNFRGWGEQNKFCLKANWIDLTHARNIVSARLWADVVKSREDYAQLPERLRSAPNQGAIDGFPALVYANGEYQGRYTVNIPKDGWMANMDEGLETHCILCGENYVSGCFRAEAKVDGSDWSDELHDAVPEAILARWNEAIRFVMNSTDEEFVAGIGSYFDLPSLIDYDLFAIASCGLDSMGKNQLYLTYDGQQWIASMYDMDSTWGLYWNGAKLVSPTYSRRSYEDYAEGREGNLLYSRLEKLFYGEIQQRWKALSAGPLSYANVMRRFEEFIGGTAPYIVEEDYAETTGGGAFTGIPSKDANNIQQLRTFAKARLAYTDAYVAALPGEYVPDEENAVEWSAEADQNIDASTGGIVAGGNYVTNAIAVGDHSTACLANVGDAGYTYLSIHQYDRDMGYIGSVNGGDTTNAVECVLDEDCSYVIFTAYPNDAACDVPAEQLNITFSETWTVLPRYKIDASGAVAVGGNYVTAAMIEAGGGATVQMANADGASFTWLTLYQYDAEGAYLKKSETGDNTNPLSVTLESGAAYIRMSAYANGVETNNDPSNQIVLTVS